MYINFLCHILNLLDIFIFILNNILYLCGQFMIFKHHSTMHPILVIFLFTAAVRYRWFIFISIQLFFAYIIYDEFFVSELEDGYHGLTYFSKSGDVMYSSFWFDNLCELTGVLIFVDFFVVMLFILANKIWEFTRAEEN